MTPLDFAIVGVYLVASLILGLHLARRAHLRAIERFLTLRAADR